MPQTTLQRYKIVITRESTGEWRVSGYWEIDISLSTNLNKRVWDLDGDARIFKTRREALEFCMNVTGVPE